MKISDYQKLEFDIGDMPEFLAGGAYYGLVKFLITKDDVLDAFKKETGHDLGAGGGAAVGAFLDFVTVNYWGKLDENNDPLQEGA